MLKEKYIQQRLHKDGALEYLVILPRTPLGYNSRTVALKPTLEEAKTVRNSILGYDPDVLESMPASNLLSTYMAWDSYANIGCLGDTHLGDTKERLDVLRQLYKECQQEHVQYVFHTGNLVTGFSEKYRTQIKVWGADAQADYVIQEYPKVPGLTTYYICGDDHEGNWKQREGLDFGPFLEARAVAAGRDDLKYVGYVQGDVDFLVGEVPVHIRLSHPGGGSTAAISGKAQRLVDAAAGEETLPNLWLVGHFHKALVLPEYKGVCVIQTGCCVEVGDWAKKQCLNYHLGGWLVKIKTSVQGKIVFTPTYYSFPKLEWGGRLFLT